MIGKGCLVSDKGAAREGLSSNGVRLMREQQRVRSVKPDQLEQVLIVKPQCQA